MKKLFCLILISIIFLISSCFSIPQSTSYNNISEDKSNSRINLKEINISINLMDDEEVENQVEDIFSSMLCEEINKEDFDCELNLILQINQRTYYKGINQCNSIYVNYKLTDEDGKILMNNCYFNKTSDSIDSSKIQYKIVSKIVKEVRKIYSKK